VSMLREILKHFIVLEGIDGSGTSTQRDLLCQALEKQGRSVFNTFEPSPESIGQIIRKILRKEIQVPPRSLALLYAADREDHIEGEKGVRKALKEGRWVVSDRYFYSSFAYQGLLCDPEEIQRINEGFPAPEYLIFLDVPIEESSRRRDKRSLEKEIFDEEDFLSKVAQRYRQEILREQEAYPEMKVLHVDGTLDIQTTHRNICTFLGLAPIY